MTLGFRVQVLGFRVSGLGSLNAWTTLCISALPKRCISSARGVHWKKVPSSDAASWMDGYMDVWMYGCMDVWMHVCVCVYVCMCVCVCMDVWMY